jgi:hypothetical protein
MQISSASGFHFVGVRLPFRRPQASLSSASVLSSALGFPFVDIRLLFRRRQASRFLYRFIDYQYRTGVFILLEISIKPIIETGNPENYHKYILNHGKETIDLSVSILEVRTECPTLCIHLSFL